MQFSSDCGQTWGTQRSFFSGALNTRDTLRTYGYTPLAASEWKSLRVDIPASYLTGHFQVRLTMLSNGGNYFYLDRLAVGAAPLLATRPGTGSAPTRVYPNPLTAASVVEFTLATPGPVELRLTDLLGRPVGPATRATGRAGLQTLPLMPADGARPAAGIYLVELRTANGRSTNKVVNP